MSGVRSDKYRFHLTVDFHIVIMTERILLSRKRRLSRIHTKRTKWQQKRCLTLTHKTEIRRQPASPSTKILTSPLDLTLYLLLLLLVLSSFVPVLEIPDTSLPVCEIPVRNLLDKDIQCFLNFWKAFVHSIINDVSDSSSKID